MSGTKWEFDTNVTEIFDDMLRKSIPQYEVMRKACFDLACHYRIPKTDILDLGSSRGESINDLIEQFGATNTWVLTEVSEPMLEVLRERFKGWLTNGFMRILDEDITQTFPSVQASIIQSILTIQFTPIEYRQQIIQNCYDNLIKGGAFLLVEKVLGANAEIDNIMVQEYYRLKNSNGYSLDEIERKRMALRGVLVPVTAKWNEELLVQAGFRKIDCFWRWMNFAGWIAIK